MKLYSFTSADGLEVWINSDHVFSVMAEGPVRDSRTIIASADIGEVSVKESVKEVVNRLKDAKAIK